MNISDLDEIWLHPNWEDSLLQTSCVFQVDELVKTGEYTFTEAFIKVMTKVLKEQSQ